MNEKSKKSFLLNKPKLSEKNSPKKKSPPVKSYSVLKNDDELSGSPNSKNQFSSFSGQKYMNSQLKTTIQKTFGSPLKNPPKQSLFPKLNMNQTKKADKESQEINFLPPINMPSHNLSSLEDGEEPIFQLPEDDDTDSIPSGLCVQQSNATSPKLEKLDPFEPIVMDDSSPFVGNMQFKSVPTTTTATPMQSPNSLYYQESNDESDIFREEEEQYIPPPPPAYGSVMVQAGENPSFSLTLPLELVKQDIPDDGTLPDLPPRLAKIVGRNKTAVSYLALCGVPVNGYQPKLIKKALKELKGYEQKCISCGYTSEARFVNDTIQLVKADLDDRLETADVTGIYSIEDQISSIAAEISQKQTFFKNSVAKMNAEKEIALRNIQIECDDDCDLIDKEWTSPEKTKKFCKGSKQLQEMRREAAVLLSAKRYDEAAMLAERADKLAEEESEAARQMMMSEYAKALQKRRDKCETDCNALESSYERKLLLMEKEKNRVENILEKRKDKLTAKKNDLEMKNKLKAKIKPKIEEITAVPVMKKSKDISRKAGLGLTLQPLTKLSRLSTFKYGKDRI